MSSEYCWKILWMFYLAWWKKKYKNTSPVATSHRSGVFAPLCIEKRHMLIVYDFANYEQVTAAIKPVKLQPSNRKLSQIGVENDMFDLNQGETFPVFRRSLWLASSLSGNSDATGATLAYSRTFFRCNAALLTNLLLSMCSKFLPQEDAVNEAKVAELQLKHSRCPGHAKTWEPEFGMKRRKRRKRKGEVTSRTKTTMTWDTTTTSTMTSSISTMT